MEAGALCDWLRGDQVGLAGAPITCWLDFNGGLSTVELQMPLLVFMRFGNCLISTGTITTFLAVILMSEKFADWEA